MSFGSDLRAERESRGIGLEEIAAGTKVSARHLLALESDEHRELPGGVFNKGFVRSYCHYIGLDASTWAKRYTETFEANNSEPDWSAFAENVRRNRVSPRPTGLRWWGVVLMLAAVVGLAWAAWHFLVRGRFSPGYRESAISSALPQEPTGYHAGPEV